MHSEIERNRIGLKPVMAFGLVVLGLFFGGLGTWVWRAQLDSAAVAPGQIAPDTNRKTIQHFEGGIVDRIHVKEGDPVEAGDLLLTLDRTASRAELERLTAALLAQVALRARLVAERDKAEEIVFPDTLLAATQDPRVRPVIDSQREVFRARREAYRAQVDILQQHIAQRGEEINGLKGLIKASESQTFYLDSEIADMSKLLEKGLVERPRVYALKRRRAMIGGEIEGARAEIARARQAIGEARVRMTELKTRMISESVEQLQDVEARILDLRQRLAAARDVFRRTEIRTPRAGRVVAMRVHTVGGVIRAGDPIMDIVPREDSLMVTARIDPADIDVVSPGQQAEVRLPAYQQRHFKPLRGRLLWVSADALTDEKEGTTYYLGRIEITEPVQNALPGARLYPGMQAETMILTGSSTVLDWILRPLERTLNRGMREQ